MTAAEAAWAQLTAETLSGGSFKLLARADRKEGGGGGEYSCYFEDYFFFNYESAKGTYFLVFLYYRG